MNKIFRFYISNSKDLPIQIDDDEQSEKLIKKLETEVQNLNQPQKESPLNSQVTVQKNNHQSSSVSQKNQKRILPDIPQVSGFHRYGKLFDSFGHVVSETEYFPVRIQKFGNEKTVYRCFVCFDFHTIDPNVLRNHYLTRHRQKGSKILKFLTNYMY